jgi:hypothetical protein
LIKLEGVYCGKCGAKKPRVINEADLMDWYIHPSKKMPDKMRPLIFEKESEKNESKKDKKT